MKIIIKVMKIEIQNQDSQLSSFQHDRSEKERLLILKALNR